MAIIFERNPGQEKLIQKCRSQILRGAIDANHDSLIRQLIPLGVDHYDHLYCIIAHHKIEMGIWLLDNYQDKIDHNDIYIAFSEHFEEAESAEDKDRLNTISVLLKHLSIEHLLYNLFYAHDDL